MFISVFIQSSGGKVASERGLSMKGFVWIRPIHVKIDETPLAPLDFYVASGLVSSDNSIISAGAFDGDYPPPHSAKFLRLAGRIGG